MTDLPTAEPYPFGTILSVKPSPRHALLTAVVYQSDPPRCGDGYRYTCLFPREGKPFQIAKVYSEEVEAVAGFDANGDVLCRNCTDECRERCFASGTTPATCC